MSCVGEGKSERAENQEAAEIPGEISIKRGSLSKICFQFLLMIRKLNFR